jgi:hypothetical protein
MILLQLAACAFVVLMCVSFGVNIERRAQRNAMIREQVRLTLAERNLNSAAVRAEHQL